MIKFFSNSGYKWMQDDAVSFRGYYQYQVGDPKVYRDEEAIDDLKKIKDYNELKSFLQKTEGMFAIVICRGDSVLFAVDRARSMPLYFSEDGCFISDNADFIRESLHLKKEDVDKDKLIELAANYYLFGHDTVYSQIKQLDLGEVAEIVAGKVKYERYFYHLNNIVEQPVEEIKKKLTETAYHTFERIKLVIGDRPVVLSMSGGYDSRFVGCMLKNVGIKDVSCYTYGKADSFEVKQSKKNAEALGFRWKCVEMADDWVSQQVDETAQRYFDYYKGNDFTAYMQNFPAVRKLHEEGWFKPNSVFLTGLCGDMPSGEYVHERNRKKPHNQETVVEQLFSDAFTRYEVEEGLKVKWMKNITDQIKTLPIEIKDFQSWQSAVDCVYTGMCHAHWYMHMNRPHDFFGYEWLMPLWDTEYLKMWYSVPVDFRVEQCLYEDWLMNEICAPYGLGQKKSYGGYSMNKWKRQLQYAVGGCLNYLLLNIGVPFKRKQDYNNFAPLELQLFKNIKSKKLVNYRRSGMMQLLDHFLIERRYGVDNYEYFVKHTKAK